MTDQDLGKWGKYVVNPPAETKTEPVLEVPTSESNLGKWAKYEVKKKDEPISVPSSGSEKSLELPSASTGNKNESGQPLTFIQKELRDKGLVAEENTTSVNSSNDAYKSAVFAKIKDPEQQKILGKSIDEANKFFANLGGKTPFQKIDEYNDGVKKLQASITPDVVASMDKNGISNLETQLAEKSKQLAIDLGLDTDAKGNVYVPKNEQAMYDQKLDDYVATETAKSKKEQGWFSNMIYGLAGATQTMSADLLDVAGFMTGLNYFNSYKQLSEGDRFNAQKLTEKSAKYDQSIQGYLENGDVVSAAGLAVTKSIESIPAMMPVLLSSLAPEAMAPNVGSAIMGATSAAGKYRSIENENVPEWKKIYNAVSTGAIMMGAMHEFGTTLLDARKAILDLGETAGKQAIENAAKKTMFSTLSDIKLPSYIRGGLNMTALGIGTDITDKVTINPELKIGSHMVDDFVVGALMDKTFALPQDLRKGLDYKQTQKFATEVLNKLPDDLDIETKILLGNKIVERDRLQQMEDKLDPKFKGKYETQLITLNSEIDKAASNYLGKAKVEEVPDLSVGKVDEVGDEQTKLDYLKSKDVKVPDGTTMEQLNALYDEAKANEPKQTAATQTETKVVGEEIVEQIKKQEPVVVEGANYNNYGLETPNAKIENKKDTGDPNSFKISDNNDNSIIGLMKGASFGMEPASNERGQIFNIDVKEKRKGTGTSLMLDALRNMKKNGTNLVNFVVPSEEGLPFNKRLEEKGYIRKIREDVVGGKVLGVEYEITDKVLKQIKPTETISETVEAPIPKEQPIVPTEEKEGLKAPKPSKPIEQMTSEEIRSFSNEVKQHEKNIYSDVFGEKADRFRQLEQSSNNPTKTKDQLKAIDSEMQQMIDELPKEKRDIWDGEAEYNASDLIDTSRMVGLVEESENISELSSSLKNPLMTFDKKNPKKETLAIFNAAIKRAQELGISTEELIGQTSKLIAKEFKDPQDAMDVVKSALESISKPLKTEQDAGKIGEKANLGSQEKAPIEGEDRGVRVGYNEKPRVEAETVVVETPKQEVTHSVETPQNEYVKRNGEWFSVRYDQDMNVYENKISDSKRISWLNKNQSEYNGKQYMPKEQQPESSGNQIEVNSLKTTENGKIDVERQRGKGNQEGLLTPEENATVTEPQNIEAPIKTQKIKAKSAEIASAIRSKRFYTSMDDLVNLKGDIAPIELIKTAWDGSLNVAAGIVEVGGEAAQVVSDAISAAVKHLEASEWYKGLSDESKAIASQKLSDEIKLKTKDLIEEANQEPIKVNVGEGEKISSIGKRIVESTKLPQEIKDQFSEEGIGYIPTSKAMRTEEAKEIIKAKLEMGGRDEVRNQILDTKNGIAPNVRVTMASIFASESLREYANAKTLEEATKFRNDATDVMQFAMEYGESLGKGVQAFTDIADMLGSDPELIGEVYRKEINKRNEKFYEKHEKNIKTAKQIIDEYLKSDEFVKKYGEKRAKKEGEITPKERKERGMAKAANAINRIADLVNARLNFEGEIEKGDNIYKAVVDLADGLLDIGVSSIQELSSKMKVELRKYLTSEQVDKISKDVFSEIKANDRLTVRKKIIKIEESDAKKIVDKLYSKMIGVSQRQLAKLLSENIELLEKEGSISDQAFKELFAKSLGQDHIKDGMLDKLKSNAKKINDVKNIEESISKLFDEAAEAEKNGASKERILELKKQINRKIKEHAIATFEAAKANQYISESFAKPTTIAERAAAHIKGNLMVPASLVSNVISNLTWVPTRKVKNGFQMLFDLSLNKVGSFREHIQSKIIKNIQDFQESESQKLGIPKEDVVVPKNLTDAMNILDKLPTSQRTKIQIGLNRDYMIGFGKGLKESMQQMWTGALGDDIKVRELGRAMHPLNALFDNIQMLKVKEEFETKKFIYNSIEATLGVPPELIFRALNFGDKPFRRGEERSRLAEIADIKGLTGIERRRFIEMPDTESVKIANEEGLQSIYAQGNLPSKVSTSIDRWLATHKTEEFGILDRPIRGVLTVLKTTSIPYIKTPVNILMETLDYAIPEVAFTKALIYASKGDRYKFTDSMARGTVGLVINNMIWSLFANGILSLAPGGNEEEKKKNVQAKVLAAEYRDKPAYYINTDAFMRHLSNKIHGTNLSTEWQQGDEISSYKRYGIWSAIMMGQAEMYRGKTPEEIRNMSIMERSFVSAPAIITSALDQSFVTGISALLNAVTGTGAEAESWVMNTTRAAESIAIPSTIRAYQQATDNQMRETRDKTIKQLTPRMVSRIKNDFKSSYMVDNGLASKVTIWGEKVKRFEDGTNVALQLFDLNKTKIYKGDFGTKIFELYEKTKDKDVLPEILKPSIRYKKENVTLDPKTFEEYQIYVGQMLKKRTESLVNSMEWESMSDDSKIKSLRRLFVGDSSRRGAYMDSFVRQNREKLNELWINQFGGEKKK